MFFYRTLDEMLELIGNKGQQAIPLFSPFELKEMETAILSREEVQRKMEFIRSAVRISTRDVSLVFTMRGWWAQSPDGKLILVPLYELVNPNRSQEAIIGLIIHEIRHKRFTLEKDALVDLARKMEKEDRFNHPAFHLLFNTIEDIRIDFIRHPFLKGEDEYIRAMNHEMFRPMSEEEKQKALELSASSPWRVFLHELITYGYRKRHSEIYESLPDSIRSAVKSVLVGVHRSLYLACWNKAVIPDFQAIITGKRTQEDERKRAAKRSLQVILEKIFPVYEKLLLGFQDSIPSEQGVSSGKSGERAEEGASQPGDFQGGWRAISQGIPEIAEMTQEEMREILENSAPASFPQGMDMQQIMALLQDAPAPQKTDEKKAEETEAKKDCSSPLLPPNDAPGPDEIEQRYRRAMSEEERAEKNREFMKGMEAARERRKEEIFQNEPLNFRLREISPLGKKLAQGLIRIFQDEDDLEIEESSTGRILSPVRYLSRSPEPFDEEAERSGSPNLALGVTIDTSGSMEMHKPEIKKMVAILLSSFFEIGRKKAEYSIGFITERFDLIKSFKENYSLALLNQMQGRIENWIDKGGRICPGTGIHLFNAVCGILEKYRESSKKNKIELVLTDGLDTGGDLSGSHSKPTPSERLEIKLKEARKSGIDIVGVGLGTRDTEVFYHFLQLPQGNENLLVELILKIAKIKIEHGSLPFGEVKSCLESR